MRAFLRTNQDPPYPALTKDELSALAGYNAETYRGLMHTPEWVEKMQELQARFDAEQAKQWERP